MKSERTIWAATALFAVALGVSLASGASGFSVLILAAAGLGAYALLGIAMRRPVDESWLPRWVAFGFLAKIAGSFVRYRILEVIYGGSGDSVRYYRVGQELAAVWDSGSVPALTGRGGFGTQVTEAVTGALFAIFTPDQLGGFVMFAIIAFGGQLGLYAAFRRWAPPHTLKPYAAAVFFLPTYAFWPSSIGKDALILFGLGVAAYGAARALEGFELRWLFLLAVGLAAVGFVRIHIAALFIGSMLATSLVAKTSPSAPAGSKIRRLAVVLTLGVATAVAVTLVPDVLGFDADGVEDITAFADEIVRRTSERGTVASGDPVSGIGDVPGAVFLVLFRPHALEANELQHFLAAAETTVLAAGTLLLLPIAIRNWRAWRANAYVVFGTFYTIGFAIAFSNVRNLGIIARQRGQVLAFFLAVIIILGWRERRRARERSSVPAEAAATEDAPGPPLP